MHSYIVMYSKKNHLILQPILFYMTKFRLNWSPPFHIAVRNIHVSSLYHVIQVKVVVCFGHGTQDLDSHAKVCSQDIVFIPSDRTSFGLYFSMHLLSAWFFMCNSLIILVTTFTCIAWHKEETCIFRSAMQKGRQPVQPKLHHVEND